MLLGAAFRRCALIGVRACPPSAASVHFSPLALSKVRSVGTVSGKSIELADFLTELGVTEKTATKMAGSRTLQKSRVSTLRANYNGLVAILGSEGALEAICKSYNILTSPPATTSAAHVAYVDILGADGAAQVIQKNPQVLKSPATTIRKAQNTLVDILGADGAAVAIRQNPVILQASVDIIKDACVDILGADGAADAIHRSVELADFFSEIGVPDKIAVQMAGRELLQKSRVSTLRSNYDGLEAILGSEGALEAICKSYNILTSPPATTSAAHVAYVDILGADGAAQVIQKNPQVLKSPATTIRKAQNTLVDILGADGAAVAIRQNPVILQASVDIIKDACVDILGADGAADAIHRSVELADFFSEIGVPDKIAVQMAGRELLQKSSISTIRTNYDGLAAILGDEGALEAICKVYSLLLSPPETTSGALTAWADILGADGATMAILKSPGVLTSPAGTIKGGHEALVEILGADGAAETVLHCPAVLNAPAETIKGAHKTLVDILGAVEAAMAILQNPTVLRAPAGTIKGACKALVAHLGKADMLQAVGNNPNLLRRPGDKLHQTALAIKGLLGDPEGRALLKAKPRLFWASSTHIERNFETLCSAFDRELVLMAVRVRPGLLYDRAIANKAVKTSVLVVMKGRKPQS